MISRDKLSQVSGILQRGMEYRVKGRKKLYLYVIMSVAVVYVALLLTLYFSESVNDGAAIHTLGDAVWYSLVTMTTVGYGDLVPVTPLGHAVGIVFLLLAAGIMVTALGAAISISFTATTAAQDSIGFPDRCVKTKRPLC